MTTASNTAISDVWKACADISGADPNSQPDTDTSLFDMGLDSLGLAELVIQLEEVYGEDCITVDDILAAPTLREVASCLPGATGAPAQNNAAPLKAAPNVVVDQPAAKPFTPKNAPPPMHKTATPAHKPTPVAPKRTPVAATPLTPANGAAQAIIERLAKLENESRELRSLVSSLAIGTTPVPMDPMTSAVPEADDVLAGLCYEEGCEEPRAFDDEWIRTTHVGSLPRAAKGESGDITEIVRMQLACGIDIINDGEWSRDNYIADLLSRIDGLGSADGTAGLPPTAASCMCEMPFASDMGDVPAYAQRFTGGNGLITLNPARVAKADTACYARPQYKHASTDALRSSLQPFLHSLRAAGRHPSQAFWSVPSPGTLAVFCEDRVFGGDHTAYVQALARAVAPEYETIAATGMLLQVDCPDLAMGRHTRHAHLTDEEFCEVAAANVEALNLALRLANVPPERVRYHVCWGNYAGPHHHDVDAASLWPILANVQAKYVVLEAANPRHIHEVALFERAVQSGHFRAEQVIVPGLIDTTAARVEHPKVIAERLLRFVRAAGHPSRVIASTDCGFASTARSVAITHDLAWRKLHALVEGARLASAMLMDINAPVPLAGPALTPTAFRAAILVASPSKSAAAAALAAACEHLQPALARRASTIDIIGLDMTQPPAAQAAQTAAALAWAVDAPIALVAVGNGAADVAAQTGALLAADKSVSRRATRVFDALALGGASSPEGAADEIAREMAQVRGSAGFDKRRLVMGRNPAPLPEQTEVVVVGAGLLGLVAAARLKAAGRSVLILEKRSVVAGIWSLFANSHSQVNSSEGGYCLKDLLPPAARAKAAQNRDHSTAAEILEDAAALAHSLKECIYTEVGVVRVLGKDGAYQVIAEESNPVGGTGCTRIIAAAGVVLAINDRVGLPRPLACPGMAAFKEAGGSVADGTADALNHVHWQGKKVVIFGCGAFAIENVRTALEAGAAHVTVVARRLGTICPKVIDYLNFVKPWDAAYRHDTGTNVKQLQAWRKLYKESTATAPSCWPAKIKHDGHTISVSDVWFIGHHLGKMSTVVGQLDHLEEGRVHLSDGTTLEADVVVGCIGFERNTTFCEQLTGRTVVRHSNYLDKNMMYLADAEIDESAFNSFFGSSVLEYAKFFSNVFVEGFNRPDELGELLWGEQVPITNVKERKWTQYIAVANTLIANDPAMAQHVSTQVSLRTEHFYRTMPPASFVAVNKKEWQELHTRLNGGVPVLPGAQLPYFFDEAASWCAPADEVLAN